MALQFETIPKYPLRVVRTVNDNELGPDTAGMIHIQLAVRLTRLAGPLPTKKPLTLSRHRIQHHALVGIHRILTNVIAFDVS